MTTDPLPSNLRDLVDDENRHEYERLWALLHADDETAYDVDRAWNELADDLDLDEAADASPAGGAADRRTPPEADTHPERSDRAPAASDSSRRSAGWKRAAGTAVTVLVAIAAVALWWQQPVDIRTSAGEQTTVTLPDGSTVELNGGSTLRYARGFAVFPGMTADTRSVRLEGEAFFSVQTGDRPFSVRTPNAQVDVLGTTFSVRTRRQGDAPTTEVVLEEGRLRLRGGDARSPEASESNARAPRSVILDAPGARSRIQGTQAAPDAPDVIDLKYAAAWRTGGFAVQDRPLPTILRDLEAQFGKDVRLQVDPAKTRPMTLHYARSVDLEDVLGDICVVQGLQYRQTQQGYVLVPVDRSGP
jgi:transmembrane sensor